jgi:pimeloyl-ACP methyl ester carboxylesterase
MNANSLPVDAPPEVVVADFERRARRIETPCGSGSLVWRSWGSGPPLLLTHGSHGAWSHWIRNIDALAERHTVFAVDLPGFGESAMPPREDHAAIAEVIAAGMRLIGGERAIDVAGFSFGGVVAAHLSAFHSALVRRLILVGTGGLDTPMGEIDLRRVRGLEGEERRAALRANLLGLMFHRRATADDLAVYLHDTNAARGRVSAGPLVLPAKLLHVLPQVSSPIDVIWGAYDRPHPDPAVQERVLRQFQPDLQFRVIPDAGHWVMYEGGAEFNRVLLELLALPPRPRVETHATGTPGVATAG